MCSSLREKADLQIIGEVSDGLEAVRKAKELQPDLILLDIGLPSLNGIEAARRICTVSAKSKILFVSQEFSSEVIQEALGTGARGYVAKIDAGKELLEALRAVLRGEQFVGSRFSDCGFGTARAAASLHVQSQTTYSQLQESREIAPPQEVRFYPDGERSLGD